MRLPTLPPYDHFDSYLLGENQRLLAENRLLRAKLEGVRAQAEQCGKLLRIINELTVESKPLVEEF